MNKNKNSISVIVPCYNYGRFLEEALNSLLNQTKKPSEIIIADDCSSDNTQEISKKFVKKNPKLISYYRNKKNLGIVKNFNKAILLTTGDYICFLGADNRFKKTYLEKTSAILDSDTKTGIVYTDFELFGERAKEVYETFNENYKGKINKINKTYEINFPEFNKKTKEIQKIENFIHGSSLYRRIAFDNVGGYCNNKLIAEDQNLFTRIIENGWNAKRIPEAILEYRQHSEDQANIKLNNKIIIEQLKEKITFLNKENKKLKEEIEIENKINLENNKIYELEQSLEKIRSSKAFKLWRLYCKITGK